MRLRIQIIYGILFLFAGFIPASALAQFQILNVDSLERALKKEKTDSMSIRHLIDRAVKLPSEEYNAKIIMLNWAAAKSKRYQFPTLQMAAYTELGWVYYESHDQINTIKCFDAGRRLAEKLGNREEQLSSLSTIASVYYYADQKKKACEMYEQVLTLCKKYNLSNGIDNAYANLGAVYYNLSKTDSTLLPKGLSYIKTGQELSLAQHDTNAIISNYQVLSRLYLDKNQYDSAMYYADRALSWSMECSVELSYAPGYFTRGLILERAKKIALAIESYTNGVRWAQRLNQSFWLAENYESLAYCYEKQGDYRKAYVSLEKFDSISTSIKNEENFAQAADIQNKYERQKKERVILKLNKNIEIKQLKIEKESQFRKKLYYIIGGVALVGLLLIILVIYQIRNLREKRASYQALQQKNIDIQHQSGQLAYQSRLIAKYQSQMNPHFIFNAINNIQGLVLTDKTNKSIAQLENFKVLMQRTLTHSEKDYITLAAEAEYLQQYVSFEQARFETPFSFSIHLPKKAESILVPPMIVQPFIENAIKHAALHTKAHSFIEVSVKIDSLLHISIRDNGKGFDMKKSNVLQKGHALDIIRSRMKLFYKAENVSFEERYFSVHSAEGTGTTVEIILPLKYA